MGTIKSQRGVYLVFTLLTLGVLFGFAALMVDIGRVSVSSLEQKQLADAAATMAIQSYIAPSGKAGTSITSKTDYEARLDYVRSNVSTLLNDSLNQLFALPGEDLVSVGETDDERSGLVLIPGTYLTDVPQTCTTNECTECKKATPVAGRKGCFITNRWNDNPQQRYGVNGFKAIVKVRPSAPVRYLFSKLLPGGGASESSGFESTSYAYQRPRNFVALVDMSPSIIEGNFKDSGRQRARFTYKLASGSAASGSSCKGTDTTVGCNFDTVSGDDFAWNSHLYLNPPSVDDHRCEGSCLYDSYRRVGVNSRSLYVASGQSDLPSDKSPLFGTTDNVPLGSICPGKTYCDSEAWFSSGSTAHYWRFLGDERYSAASFPTVVDSNNPTWIRQPIMRRFKSDYFGISIINTPRGIFDYAGTTPTLDTTDEDLNGNYLVEDPSGLRNDTRYFSNPNGTDDRPSFVDFPTNDPLSVNGVSCWQGRTENCIKGMFAPEVERNYSGPEPYNSILKGLYRVHDGIQNQEIPGDRFMVVPFDDVLGAAKSIIPLTPVIRDPLHVAANTLTTDQEKLRNLLLATQINTSITPTDVDFSSKEQIRSRIQMGLIPDASKRNTNISRAVASTLRYLEQSGIQGSDTYLLLFTDFVASGTCSVAPQITNNKTIDQIIRSCSESSDFLGGIPWAVWGAEADYTNGENSVANRAWRGLLDFYYKPNNPVSTVQYNLLDKMQNIGVTPVFFVFNGKDGGKPIFPDPTTSGCLSDQKISEFGNRLSSGVLTGEWGFKYTLSHDRDDEYMVDIGILASEVSKRKGRYIRLLPGCPHYPGSDTQTKLNSLCNAMELVKPAINGVPQIISPSSWTGNLPVPSRLDSSLTKLTQTGWGNAPESATNPAFFDYLNRNLGIMKGITPGGYHDSGGHYLLSFDNGSSSDWSSENMVNWSCGTQYIRDLGSLDGIFKSSYFSPGMGDMLSKDSLVPLRSNSFIISDVPTTQITTWGTLRCEPSKSGKDMSDTIFDEIKSIFQKSTASIVSAPAYEVS